MEEESYLASDNVTPLLLQTVARTAREIPLRVETVTQILVSHTNHCFKSLSINRPCLGPVNGRWSAWSDWSSCTKLCGTGTQRSQRTCTQPAPDHGGRECRGKDSRMRDCNTEPCLPGTLIGITHILLTKQELL